MNRSRLGGVHPDVKDTDERLMVALYEEHGAVLLGFVLRYVNGRAEAEDVVQETLLRTWRHLDRLDASGGNPRAYLFTVARNVITDQWRAAQRRPQLVAEGGPVPSHDDVEAALEGWLVRDALARLTPAHRAVITALYYDGLSVDETAARLGIPSGTVKSRSYYAVRTLRGVLEEMGVLA